MKCCVCSKDCRGDLSGSRIFESGITEQNILFHDAIEKKLRRKSKTKSKTDSVQGNT